jgi:hypothetical protein
VNSIGRCERFTHARADDVGLFGLGALETELTNLRNTVDVAPSRLVGADLRAVFDEDLVRL